MLFFEIVSKKGKLARTWRHFRGTLVTRASASRSSVRRAFLASDSYHLFVDCEDEHPCDPSSNLLQEVGRIDFRILYRVDRSKNLHRWYFPAFGRGFEYSDLL